MNATELLQALHQKNILLSCEGERLHARAAKGTLTPDLREAITEHKPELLALLSGQQPPEAEDRCSICGALVECYSDYGIPFCERHRWEGSLLQCAVSPALQMVTQETFFLQDLSHIAGVLSTLAKPVALDLETTGLDEQRSRVVSIMMGIPGRVFILDIRPYYKLPPEQQLLWKNGLKELLMVPGITWIGHNLKFDWKFLSVHFGIQITQVYDTMLAEQLIHGVGLSDKSFSVDLQHTAQRYKITVEKAQRKWFPGLDTRHDEWKAPFPEQQVCYMVQDIEVPCQLHMLQQQAIQKHQLERVVQLEMQALPALAAMELRGVLIDQELWRSVLKKKGDRQLTLERDITTTLGQALQTTYDLYQHALQQEEHRLMQAYQSGSRSVTWGAYRKKALDTWRSVHPQPPKPLRTEQGMPAIKLSSTVQLLAALRALKVPVASTKESALEPYAAQFPIVAKVLQWKGLQHFRSCFGENILAMIDLDGRLRGDFAQIGAVSGRIICSHPNLQQMPAHEKNEEENIRRCFIASPGCQLLKADLSNIELRILAEVAQDQELLRLFNEGEDLHAETAKFMFKLPPDTDTRKYLYKGKAAAREIAKTINYGLAYGMGAQGLANRVGVSQDEAKALIKIYFTTYAGVARWLRVTAQQALQQGYAATLAGRRRFFSPANIFSGASDMNRMLRGDMERSAKNHPIQGTNADIIKRALTLLYTRLPEGAHIVLAVHDEVVLECPEQCVSDVEQLLKDAMVQACRSFLNVVAIPEPDVIMAPYWKKE